MGKPDRSATGWNCVCTKVGVSDLPMGDFNAMTSSSNEVGSRGFISMKSLSFSDCDGNGLGMPVGKYSVSGTTGLAGGT